MADAQIINYGQPIGGGATVIPDNSSSTVIESTDGKEYIGIDTTNGNEALKLSAAGVEGLRIVEDTIPSVVVGSSLASVTPAVALHIRDDSQNPQLIIDRSSGQFKIEQNTAQTTAQSNVNLRLAAGNIVRVMLLSGGNVGVGTTNPGQIFDVNQGSGNMIADGYDTHSLASYKENLTTADSGYLAKVTACPPKQWTSVPYVSADEIKAATIEQFGQDAWDGYFPEDDSHRAGALLSMPKGEMKTWIDAWAESKREERRLEEKWQQVRLGLVADADDTAANFSESVSKNTDGKISGINTMSYIGTLHAALVELSRKLEDAEARIGFLEADAEA